MTASRTFEELVAEAGEAPVDGWDFSWLAGRATEERPSWGYQRLMSQRLAASPAVLDIDTGGGEILAGADRFPATMAATESWPPNLTAATKLLHPRGVVVVATYRPAAPAVRGRSVRPRSQPAPGKPVVDRDRTGAHPWRLLLRAARRTEKRVRAGRVLPSHPVRIVDGGAS